MRKLVIGLCIVVLFLLSGCAVGKAGSTGKISTGIIQNVKCGDTITKSVTLTAKDSITFKPCPNSGLTISTGKVVLDCKGLTIGGS
ncbi:MAG TPA: hypothetical protein VJI15_01515, partial [Candidatus Nanoarchaeia archaeon]|nr:hypothetical protein [Candidatus Nanoarchaeia archaeon]